MNLFNIFLSEEKKQELQIQRIYQKRFESKVREKTIKEIKKKELWKQRQGKDNIFDQYSSIKKQDKAIDKLAKPIIKRVIQTALKRPEIRREYISEKEEFAPTELELKRKRRDEFKEKWKIQNQINQQLIRQTFIDGIKRGHRNMEDIDDLEKESLLLSNIFTEESWNALQSNQTKLRQEFLRDETRKNILRNDELGIGKLYEMTEEERQKVLQLQSLTAEEFHSMERKQFLEHSQKGHIPFHLLESSEKENLIQRNILSRNELAELERRHQELNKEKMEYIKYTQKLILQREEQKRNKTKEKNIAKGRDI